MKYSVIIPTYNRADELRHTLKSVSELKPSGSWEVIVVDNNSNDRTHEVVSELADGFPVELRYVFEREQGRSAALNAGIKASCGDIIAVTDDDVRIEAGWLDRAADGLEEFGCDYVGGKVLPIWEGEKPAWLPEEGGRHWSVIALLNYGREPIEFGNRVPLGVNMAFRRAAFARAGLWDNRVGRKAGTLLGQEVREWGLRARAAGLRGFYIPEMVVHHIIPRDRLSKRYFRRWFYWHGISRAMIYQQSTIDMEAPEDTRLDFSKVPHIAGIPRYMYRKLLRSILKMAHARIRRDSVAAFEHETWVFFFAGISRQRWKDRKSQPAS